MMERTNTNFGDNDVTQAKQVSITSQWSEWQHMVTVSLQLPCVVLCCVVTAHVTSPVNKVSLHPGATKVNLSILLSVYSLLTKQSPCRCFNKGVMLAGTVFRSRGELHNGSLDREEADG